MSNNNKTLIIGLLILLGVGGLIAYREMANSQTQPAQPQEPVVQNEEPNQSTPSNTTPQRANETAGLETYNKFVTTPAPEGSKMYVLSDTSQASYTVTKVFVGKPQAEVVGVTEEVQGAGWYDDASKKFYLKADIALDKLKSDSEKRDEDIMPLFTPATATIELNGDNMNGAISMTEPFETQLTADLTIGSVTKPVTFDVKGTLDDSKFTAEGTTEVMMSDFGITPPSALDIFSVEDKTTLKFNVEGLSLEQTPVQE
jgi:polyisoprenoid-binding protein YceI